MRQFQTKSFKNLKKEWYKKLEQSGFKDAETEHYLKEWDSHYFQSRIEPDLFDIKQTYFYQAEQFLQTDSFDSNLDREIWRLHSDGLSYREICTRIKATQTTHTQFCSPTLCDLFCPCSLSKEHKLYDYLNKDKVNWIIDKIKAKMKQNMIGRLD